MEVNGTRQTVSGWRQFAWRFWELLRDTFCRRRVTEIRASEPKLDGARHLPLRKLRLTDGVSRTLFEEYRQHRSGAQGDDETGWLLLGLRQGEEALALATLPAGMQSDAGMAHVLFNSLAQGVGSRIVRQHDRRLKILGVVHTHPGSLRHPSDGDLRGDRKWVQDLRGGEAVFGIGTADRRKVESVDYGESPQPSVQLLGELTFSWYSLNAGSSRYQRLPVELTLGPDLARPLHSVWGAIEEHAVSLERLYRQQAGLMCQVIEEENRTVLAVQVPLAEPKSWLRVLLRENEPAYVVERGEDLFSVDPAAGSIEQGIYLILAELAALAVREHEEKNYSQKEEPHGLPTPQRHRA